MVIRHGYYEIQVMGKQLKCLLCGGATFSHREVYLDLELPLDEEETKQLALQSFMCSHCSSIQYVQEQTKGLEANIVYKGIDEHGL